MLLQRSSHCRAGWQGQPALHKGHVVPVAERRALMLHHSHQRVTCTGSIWTLHSTSEHRRSELSVVPVCSATPIRSSIWGLQGTT